MQFHDEQWQLRGYSPEEILQVRSLLWSKRKALLKRMGRFKSPRQREAYKRWVNERIRKIVKRLRMPTGRRPDLRMLLEKFKPSDLLNGLCSSRERRWLPPIRRRYAKPKSIDLIDLSFVEDPIGTMQRLQSLAEAEVVSSDVAVNFLDPHLRDIGPYLILQAMWEKMYPVFRNGSITRGLQGVVESVGLREAMSMAPFRNKVPLSDVSPFKLRKRRATGSSTSKSRHLDVQKREEIADDLVAWIDGWLNGLLEQKLNREGRRSVQIMVGEVLDNAERHSDVDSEDGEWAIAGCLRKDTSSDATSPVFWCHLGYLSLGATVSESMATCSETVRLAMDAYIKRHVGVFGHTEESLTVVYALQDGVTRMQKQTEGMRGGTGLQDVMQFFAGMAGPATETYKPSMVIVSGRTCILLQTPHLYGLRRGGPDAPRQIWFNDANDENLAPDRGNVLQLPGKLQGTLISMCFPLNMDFMRISAEDNDHAN